MLWASIVKSEDFNNPDFERQIFRIIEFMDANQIWALAGPEVGFNKRVIFIGNSIDHSEIVPGFVDPRCLINPVVEVLENVGNIVREDCLTMGPYVAEVYRPSNICVKALNLLGLSIEFKPTPKKAALIMHAMDHLGGIRLVDKPCAQILSISNTEKKEFLAGKDLKLLHPLYPTEVEIRKNVYDI